MEDATKRCPYCGETILATAIKCKYCGEWLAEKSSVTPTPPPPRPSPPPPPPPRLATPTDLPQAQPEAEVEVTLAAPPDTPDTPEPIEGFKKGKKVKSTGMKILILIELAIVLVILYIIFHREMKKFWTRIVITLIACIQDLLNEEAGYVVSSFCISIPWGIVGLGTDFDWVTAIVLFALSFLINWVIIKHYEYKYETKSKRRRRRRRRRLA